MDDDLLALAIPVFFALIALEAIVARAQKKRVYALHDTIGSLACGAGQTVLGVAINVAVVAAYAWVYRHAALLDIPRDAAWVLPVCVVAVDFCHYWFHRSSHRVNALWAGHAVHHQSEEYNLSTALRQSWLEPFQSLPFYVPLAILGFPTEVFLLAHTIQTIYQFWVHTKLVGRLGPLEWVFNTPSAHRVHHAINPEYIDKNYGGIFILWDRMFGTFEPEREPAAYGTVKPLASFNPYWANVYEWARIAGLALAARTRREALFAPIAPPEWLPRSLGGPQPVPPVDPARRPFDKRLRPGVDAYVTVQFVLVLLATAALLPRMAHVDGEVVGVSLWLMAALATLGLILDRRAWALRADVARALVTPWVGYALLGGWGLALGAVVGVASALWGARLARR